MSKIRGTDLSDSPPVDSNFDPLLINDDYVKSQGDQLIRITTLIIDQCHFPDGEPTHRSGVSRHRSLRSPAHTYAIIQPVALPRLPFGFEVVKEHRPKRRFCHPVQMTGSCKAYSFHPVELKGMGGFFLALRIFLRWDAILIASSLKSR